MGIEQPYHSSHTEMAHSDASSKDFTPPPPMPHAEHGPVIDHKIPQEDAVPSHPDLWWPRMRRHLREPLSEFFGVFILLMFGDGVVAQVVLSKGEKGSYQSISWGWG
jgi:aquaglyceroporin related protein, other eukaryote